MSGRRRSWANIHGESTKSAGQEHGQGREGLCPVVPYLAWRGKDTQAVARGTGTGTETQILVP
jgi:hypothetical protein